MRTWAEDAKSLLSDDQAEALVVAGVDIVVREAFEPSSQKKQRPKKGGMRKVRMGEARLLVVGAVLVLGAAVVVGIHSRHGSSGDADWRMLFDTFGALGERVVGMFGEAQLGL
jgi:predicted metal-dependent TIM-barrel fold hydrolase